MYTKFFISFEPISIYSKFSAFNRGQDIRSYFAKFRGFYRTMNGVCFACGWKPHFSRVSGSATGNSPPPVLPPQGGGDNKDEFIVPLSLTFLAS